MNFRNGLAYTGLLSLVIASSGMAKTWDFQNDPTRLGSAGEIDTRFQNLPLSGALEKEPWSETYWPSNFGGINYRWNAKRPRGFNLNSPSLSELRQMTKEQIAELAPSEKYDIAMGRYDYPLVAQVDAQVSVRNKDWAGICHGWAPAAFTFDEPAPVEIVNPDGIVVPFGSSDVKGLLSQYMAFHSGGDVTQVGFRCSKAGRVFGTKACKDINAGSLHVALANLVGVQKRGFVVEIDPGHEVWNQPIYAYESAVIGSTARGVRVRTKLIYGDELDRSSWEPVILASQNQLKSLNLDYNLELDHAGRITGGEWNSGRIPDFLWTLDISGGQQHSFRGYFSGLSKIYKPSI